MTQGRETDRSHSETDTDEVAVVVLKGFVDRQKARGEAMEARRQHGAEASARAESFWDQYDMDDVEARIQAYQERNGEGFRVGSNRFRTMEGAYQYPFVDVAGVPMTIRELTPGEVMRGPRDGGDVVGIQLVVKADGLPGPVHRDERTGDIEGEAVFATVYGTRDGLIDYPDETISGDPVLAEAADREVLGQLQAVQRGLIEMLDNPQPLAA